MLSGDAALPARGPLAGGVVPSEDAALPARGPLAGGVVLPEDAALPTRGPLAGGVVPSENAALAALGPRAGGVVPPGRATPPCVAPAASATPANAAVTEFEIHIASFRSRDQPWSLPCSACAESRPRPTAACAHVMRDRTEQVTRSTFCDQTAMGGPRAVAASGSPGTTSRVRATATRVGRRSIGSGPVTGGDDAISAAA